MSTVETERSPDQHLVELIIAAISPRFEQLEAQFEARFEQLESKIGEMDVKVSALQDEMDSQRAFQIDQERERHSLLLSAAATGRGGLPSFGPNQTTSGARFKRTRNDLKPASIY